MESKNIHRRLPAPQVQDFVVCREIWHNPHNGRIHAYQISQPLPDPAVPRWHQAVRLRSRYGWPRQLSDGVLTSCG